MLFYKSYVSRLQALSKNSNAALGAIGASLCNRLIYSVFVGSKAAPRQIIITAGIHAREHISCETVLRQIEHALDNAEKIKSLGGITFLPLLNPDGLEILTKGILAVKPRHWLLLKKILANQNLLLYKANARGVDLNVNFDALWGTGKQNLTYPHIENYIGTHPFSEPETIALRDFTTFLKPAATVSYHAKGREIYWEFGQKDKERERDRLIVEKLNEKLQYKILDDDGTSAGGYKDWCIQSLGIPSFTIELVDDNHSHPFVDYNLAKEDIERNLDLPIRLLEQL